MAWLRIDDGFTENPKIAELTDKEFRIWMRTLCYAARNNGKEGRLSFAVRREVRGLSDTVTARFTAIGLLDKTADSRVFQIHDWRHYNPKDPDAASRMARLRAERRANDERTADEQDPNCSGPRAQPRARGPSPSPEDQDLQGEGTNVTEAGGEARRSGSPPARPRYVDPSKVCDDCGATYGEGHHSHCPRLAKNRVEAHR